MSGLSTKNVQTQGGGGLKTIQPGQHKLKINKIELKQYPFMEADNGFHLILHVETEALPDFEGFFIDVNDESLGRYEGQIGQVKTNRFYYKDGTTKGGTVINRDMELLKQFKNLCMASDNMKWFDQVDNKFDTIEDFVEGMNKSNLFDEKWFNICVAGKEFERKNGYTGYDLYFPKLTRGKVAIEAADTAVSKLISFNEAEHWVKLENKEVADFGNDENGNPNVDNSDPLASGADISGAPEFEL